MKNNRNKKIVRLSVCALAVVMLVSALACGLCLLLVPDAANGSSGISLFDGAINTQMQSHLDKTVAYQLPDTVKDTDDLSVIIEVKEPPLLEAYQKTDKSISFSEYILSDEAAAVKARIAAERKALISALDKSGVSYELGADYASIISGFEIMIKAGDFESVCKTVGDDATPIVGEVYEASKAQLVENTVNVQSTGIFNSEGFGFDGSGMVIAVLDTGLDYTHTAFSVSNFSSSNISLTLEGVAALVDETRASEFTQGLTAEDVYVSEKVPYAYDYADKDPDVFPLQSNHGTHVAGVIAGKDDTITGVAPGAQLAIMKTFSDVESTARASWILSALEDCVNMQVDVINMSLGTGCGFSRETDKETMSGVYDRIRDAGISLVVAASNSYSSAYGSDKNGNLGLTTNPDTATVGSPGTYDGAMSVASINGAETPYLLYNSSIMYFTESSDRVQEERNFVEGILAGKNSDTVEMEYVVIPGVGRAADYTGLDLTGKIALVKRGAITFEEKANIAEEKGAAAVIIYNNVSGEIKMNTGETKIPACSISQDDGETLAEAGGGKITICKSQTSGPFMSGFSSWGPTPDLGIKPEITAHGGMILSAVPGQDYDRISGTSMACPNIAGVSALLRQYVIKEFALDPNKDSVEIAALVNRLMMSSADIILNTNGLPYSVRKQGAGIANLISSRDTTAYILTYDREDGKAMDKTKIELGDDPKKTGVYELKFSVVNFGDKELSYDVSAYVMTEGDSETKTNDGKTTVTEEAYALLGASVEVTAITGGTQNGSIVTVAAGKTADVTVTIKLSNSDKKYLDKSFANGMYVEGYVTLEATSGTEIDLSVPYLAYYGDWTVAPIFDLDYFATNADELDDSIDMLDKTLPDAYATRPIGGMSDDYVNYLGSYYFTQQPGSKMIAANRDYISISNQDNTVNSLRFVWAGLLRNAEHVDITITEDSTGEVVFEKTEKDIRKSYGDGGSIYPANIKIEFNSTDYALKNNATYTVKLKAYVDYGDGGGDTNLNNEFTFPLTSDFQAPAITDCEFYTEYDKNEKKTRLFAKMAVYDNHYAMALNVGYISEEWSEEEQANEFVLNTFDKYLTPVYSEKNSTTYVTYELTDYIYEIKNNTPRSHKNTITVACYDYALNESTYEIPLPTEYLDIYFEEEADGLTLSPNEVYTLAAKVYPDTEWPELLNYSCSVPPSGKPVATVVNNKLIAMSPGQCVVTAETPDGKHVARFTLTVLGPDDEGYKEYDKPVADSFTLTGYYVDKAFYFLSTDERDLGVTGDEAKFNGSSYDLSMFPSEAVTLRYRLDKYFDKDTEVVFSSSNESIVKVDKDGKITAQAEGFASISVNVIMDGASTYYSQSISVTVKDPYLTTGPSLTHYFGLGGTVDIPESLALTEIGQYAFSNFDYIPKTEFDEISEESPDSTKIWFKGDECDAEVVKIPEGVKSIGPYAFAGLKKLKRVELPSTLETIQQGAFYGCSSLTSIVGIENVKFINQSAFEGCDLLGVIKLDNAVAIANYSFAGNKNLQGVVLAESTQSVGAFAFAGNKGMKTVTIKADFIKLGQRAFQNCESLSSININASVIPTGTFDGCSALTDVTIGKDVAVIGEFAFRGTKVSAFKIAEGNTAFKAQNGGAYLTNTAGDKLLLVAPMTTGAFTLDGKITSVGNGAFSSTTIKVNKQNGAVTTGITSVSLPGVTSVGNYAFAGCTEISSFTFGKLASIGDYAFYQTKIAELPFDSTNKDLKAIGKYAFAATQISSVVIPDGMTVGDGAFNECTKLTSVTIRDNVTIGEYAFAWAYKNSDLHTTIKSFELDGIKYYYYDYSAPLTSLVIGKNANIGAHAFDGAAGLTSVTLGEGAIIGDYAFYSASHLESIDLSKVQSIGEGAFSGLITYVFDGNTMSNYAMVENKDLPGSYDYIYYYYAPTFTSVDISSVTSLGNLAFAHCRNLTSVKLGSGIDKIPDEAFTNCTSLGSINLDAITEIGDNAFRGDAFVTLDLSGVTTIGKYAFAENEQLTAVTFNKAGMTTDEGAFAYCPALSKLENLKHASVIGDYAFAYTAVTEANLVGATSIGAHAFLKDTLTDFKVTLGSDLEFIGDNPFGLCKLEPFGYDEVLIFNGKKYPAKQTTYDLNEHIRYIDGSLYRVVPNGLELIAYAENETNGVSNAGSFTVADGTVRISALAFAGSDLKMVTMPYTTVAIGDKAFYRCNDLKTVTFNSYYSPMLEEAFDYNYYITFENMPATGEYSFQNTSGEIIDTKSGLGIVPYYMWNIETQPTGIYYGANFVDYIGHVSPDLVMVRPVNGQQYDSFVLAQYFGATVDGIAAPDEISAYAIKLINQLPRSEVVTLSHKPQVVAARAAYDAIVTDEQRAVVKHYADYANLEACEARLTQLESLNENPETPAEPIDEQTPPILIILIIAGALVLAAGIAAVIAIIIARGKKKKSEGTETTEAAVEAADEVAATTETEGADPASSGSETPADDTPAENADEEALTPAPADEAEVNDQEKPDDESGRA